MSKAFKLSVKILGELNHSINEITKAGTQTYRNYDADQSEVNAVIMYSVYAYLIIKVSAFYDELTTQLEKIELPNKPKELKEAIKHFKKLYKIYKVYKFRNFIAHNRKVVRGAKSKRNKTYRYITDGDISRISRIKSPGEFESFSVATNRIMESFQKLKPTNERDRKSN